MLARTFMPLILFAIAIGLFFVYIRPVYRTVQDAREEAALLRGTLASARDIQETRDELVSKYNAFSGIDLARLEKMVPDHVDNVRLILEIDAVANRYGMSVRNLSVGDTSGTSSGAGNGVTRGETNQLGTVSLSFSVSSSYQTFLQFLRDLERSLRVVEITNLSFAPAIGSTGDGSVSADFYTFSVTLQTYWLR